MTTCGFWADCGALFDEDGTVDVGHAESHLRLVVNEHDGAVVWGIQSVILAYGYLLLMLIAVWLEEVFSHAAWP